MYTMKGTAVNMAVRRKLLLVAVIGADWFSKIELQMPG